MEKLNRKDFESLYYILDVSAINKAYDVKIDSIFKDFKQGVIDSQGLAYKLGKLEEHKTAIVKIGEVMSERLKEFNNLLNN